MRLREYQAKRVFSETGIAVPRGGLARTAAEAARVAEELGTPVVLKPQLGVKGRGKLGGIGFADGPRSARSEAERLLAMTIKGEPVRTLLVEERVAIAGELYLAVTVDPSARCPVIITSAEGGVDIEEVARERPDRVRRTLIDILRGPGRDQLREATQLLGDDAAGLVENLYGLFRSHDAEIVEINPLVRTHSGELVAVDAVLNVDRDAVERHEELLALREEIPIEDEIAEEAARASWTYIEMPGDIGVLSSGAGLTMAILDLIHSAGGSPANFLDTAQIDDDGIYAAFELMARARPHRVLLVNLFAGLNRCDRLAEGISRYLGDRPPEIPVVVRMVGNLEEEGHRILRQAGVTPFSRIEEAVGEAVRLAAEAAP
jgi:succinyl-CoA synthetase beta subunit